MAITAPITGAPARARPTLSLFFAERPDLRPRHPRATQPTNIEARPPLALLRALAPARFAALRITYFEELFAAFERDDIEAAVDMLLGRLDATDGDPDVELNGDELDGTGGEDDFISRQGYGPGCTISDEDDDGLDRGELTSYESIRQGCYSLGGNDECDDDEPDDPAARKPHVRRAQRRLAL